jgi:arylsulfatase A
MVSHRASKRLVLFTVIAVLSASVGAASDAPQRLPNIVYIRADDLGYGDLGCYNRDSKIPTPHMDRLAAEGMRFLDAHSVASVCTPTRYGILTGRYAWRTPMKTGGLFGYSAPLINTWRITVPSLLKRHGYQTGCVGKWHLGLDWSWHKYEARPDFSEPIRVGPLDYGFDYFFGIARRVKILSRTKIACYFAVFDKVALANLGHKISDQTVGHILKAHGIAACPAGAQVL